MLEWLVSICFLIVAIARLVGQVVSDRKKTISDLSSTLDQLRDDLKFGLQLHTAFVSTQTRDGVDMLVESVDGLGESACSVLREVL